MITYKITNKELFDSSLKYVEFEGAEKLAGNIYTGTIYFRYLDNWLSESSGNHHVNDWKEEYGFIIIEK